ncbi:hypothetical protein Tco_0865560 [Tanacetum coccineum]
MVNGGLLWQFVMVVVEDLSDALCEKFHIPDTVHPELPGRNNRIRNSPTGKIGVNTSFFDFANYRIPLSQFLVDVLEYFQINLSQLSVIAAAKLLFRDLCDFLATHPAPFRKFLESFLCLVGISCSYELDDNVYPVFLADDDEEMDLFAFISHADPTKENFVVANIVRIEDEVPAIVDDKPKGTRKKRKTASGASGSVLPPKRPREDHGTSGDAGASTAGKSLAVL